MKGGEEGEGTCQNTVAERLGEEDAVIFSPLKDIVGKEKLLIARWDRGSALEDNIKVAVDLVMSVQLPSAHRSMSIPSWRCKASPWSAKPGSCCQ